MKRHCRTYQNVSAATPLCADATVKYPPASYLLIPAGATVTAKSRDPYGADNVVMFTASGDTVLPGDWVELSFSSPISAKIVAIWEWP